MPWRKSYVICPHVRADPDTLIRSSGVRVCCVPCYNLGFLLADLEDVEDAEFSVSQLPANNGGDEEVKGSKLESNDSKEEEKPNA